ncbi:TIGR02281 family clan AA aspartic protease [Oricola thermophila]|uniref:TIGR02281 family clan AA aspartic protease n=1 Tax=Oricola thermophila TaxID=2742145 RepID=A0A6N1V9J3_9HYPH|nr:TIGR02281 family clan AA aspartic protease [Oricola thermophila]QKV17634.1 TIGR02281 family clan AA aspartic protease [Oricola thermophila]
MNAFTYIFFGILGGALLILIIYGNDGTVGPMTDGQFAGTVYLGLIGAMIAAGMFASGRRFGQLARQAGIWIAVLILLVIGYEYRFELQETATRVTSGLVPGAAITQTSANGNLTVTIQRSGRHFETAGTVNGTRQTFLVDTGASTVVLTESTARKAGIDPATLDYRIPIATANGMAMAARVSDIEVTVGGIVRSGMIALVAKDDQLSSNLLGMNFLDTLDSFEVRGDRMVLRN